MGVFLVLLDICIVFAAGGYAIRFKNKLNLIAGYDASYDENPKRTAYAWGSSLLVSAVVATVLLNIMIIAGVNDLVVSSITIIALVMFMPLKWLFVVRYNRTNI